MYKDDDISLNFYAQYYELVSLLKQKGAASAKLSNLEILLEYFINNYEFSNEEEKKLTKNIIMIATDITNKTNTYYNFVKNKKERCLNLTKDLKSKQKEPTK